MRGPMLKAFAVSLCVCGFGLGGATALAQSAVPIEQEPAHRLVLQNEQVRAFEISLAPGKETLWHVHRLDGISVRLADATVEDQPQNGPAQTLQLRRGAVAYGATPTALTHKVRNVGTTTFHNVYIELLQQRRAGAGQPPGASDRQAEFENERVRAVRRTLAPGEVTATHTHASEGVAVLVDAGRLEISGPDGAVTTADVNAGAVRWIASGTRHALKNVGDAPLEIVDIELK